MPGIDRSRIVGESAEVLNEFSCGICQDVFNQPMVTPCRHTFCKECIDEWLSGHNTCPNDRKPLTKRRLTEAPRFVLNIIDRMQIKCRLSDRGCPSVHSVDHDSTHMTVCQFVVCRRCGLNDPGPSHDCVIHLLQTNVNLTEDNNQLRTENENLKTSNSDLMSSEMAVKEEIQRFKTELDLNRDELKTLNEKVIQLEREKAIIDSLNRKTIVEQKKRMEDLKTKDNMEKTCGRCGHKDPGPNHDCVIHLLQRNYYLNEIIDHLIAENANLKTLNSDLMSSKMADKEEQKKWNEIVKSSENGNKDNEKLMAHLDESKIEVTPAAHMATLPTLPKVSLNERSFVIKSYLRGDQTIKDVGKKGYQDSSVRIVAPIWVKQGLKELTKHLPKNFVIEVNDNYGKNIIEPISGELSLRVLQQMARNDGYNTNGLFNLSNYGPGIDRSVVLSIKDLSRQCVIVGSDWTTGFGGFPKGIPQRVQKKKVFICDLSGLQFQTRDNTGRLVVVSQQMPKGLLDDFIYEKVVKQPKTSYVDAFNDRTGRFIRCNDDFLDNDYFFDSEAYIRFVANDVLTCGLALDLCCNEEINFKFLKYGTGYFPFLGIFEKYHSEGVARGLEQLLPRMKKIKVIEFPFYEKNERLVSVCRKYGLLFRFSRDDALKQTHPRYVTATNNCSDPHSCAGNAMGFGSIDSSIAENLSGKAMKFSPFINQSMSEVLLDDL